MPVQPDLFSHDAVPARRLTTPEFVEAIGRFEWQGRKTEIAQEPIGTGDAAIPVLRNEFWTRRQRMAHRLHEISYRACFKPQLPEFFISRLTTDGAAVYDPFMGRGTTVIQAALMGRVPFGCDINPLSSMLALPRLSPPLLADVRARLMAVDLSWSGPLPDELLVFYHPETLGEICALRDYLLDRCQSGGLDTVDEWIRMVAVSRLTGHSPGFFSVYRLPPNQALSVESQRKINADRGQVPARRDVRRLILWLRCWFCGIEASGVRISISRRLDDWQAFIREVFTQLARLLKPGGFVAFEVGEVRGGRLRLEEAVLPCGLAAGLTPVCLLINDQSFTKTANIWGVANNRKGTNTNRILVFRK